jgi:hypothetical protein
MTLPVWRIVLSVPDATPDRERSTLPSSSDVIGGTMSPSVNRDLSTRSMTRG